MKRLLTGAVLVVLGALAGGAATIAGIRASRIPGNPFYELRGKFVAPVRNTELEWLTERYGPERKSQGPEEWIVRDFFEDRRNGFFVDIGAAHHEEFSNTWYAETHLEWSGIAVDALEQYRTGYEKFRPRTKYFTFYISDQSATNATLFFGNVKGVSSAEPNFTRRYGKVQGSVEVPTITLNDLLDAQGVRHIDFLSMDIELAEPKALAGFDLNRFKPSLLTVEAHPEVRQQLFEYFAQRGYVVVGKYLRVDDMNVWFMPTGTQVKPFPVHALDGSH